jgi:DNA-binding response OmpR family regulator
VTMVDTPPAHTALLLCLSGQPGPVQRALEDEGFWVTISHDLTEALWRLRTLGPELVMLQVGGRDPDDWVQCQRIVEEGGPPLLVLLEVGPVEARLAALLSGADDVLVAPLHPLELVAHARALLRREHGSPERSFLLRHRELTLDPDAHVATLGEQPLHLSPLEFRLLRTLLEAPRKTFSRDELLARTHVFDEQLSSERSIDLHITELRHKLGDSASAPRYLATVRGVGYRLASQAESIAPPAAAQSVPNSGPGLFPTVSRVLAGAPAGVVVATDSAREAAAVAAHLRRRGLRAEALPDACSAI